MSFDISPLAAAVADHGVVMRVLVAKSAGSVPREAGTAMLVWADGQSGTIGGGELEFSATRRAREMLATDTASATQAIPLGPTLGQCCGGSVTLVWERFDAANMPVEFPFARRISGDEPRPKIASTFPQLSKGWLVEHAEYAKTPVWIWGGGHVGAALANVLAPLPDSAVTVIETTAARLLSTLPPEAEQTVAASMPSLARHAPQNADHLIVTHSHEIDLALCDALLRRGFASCGLIGSATKWARFRTRLAALGHRAEAITRIACPIGDPALGKHPQVIAVGVANALLLSRGASAQNGGCGDQAE